MGVRNGGHLMHRRKSIITRALPANLPDAITIDISDLKIGMFVYIKDLRSDVYDFLAADNSVVVGVKTARNAIEDELAESEEAEGADGEDGESPESSSDAKTEENKDS